MTPSPALALLLLAAPLAPLAVALSAPPPPRGAPALVLVAPWARAEPAVRAAGGLVLAGTGLPALVLAHDPEPGFAARLAGAGAWAVIDGRRAALLCGETP